MQEHRRPRGPMLTEKELLDLVSSLLPIGEGNAVHLGPSLIEQLQVGSISCREQGHSMLRCAQMGCLAEHADTDGGEERSQ